MSEKLIRATIPRCPICAGPLLENHSEWICSACEDGELRHVDDPDWYAALPRRSEKAREIASRMRASVIEHGVEGDMRLWCGLTPQDVLDIAARVESLCEPEPSHGAPIMPFETCKHCLPEHKRDLGYCPECPEWARSPTPSPEAVRVARQILDWESLATAENPFVPITRNDAVVLAREVLKGETDEKDK